MSLAPGTLLGSYEIVSLLGSGGMGEVYRARDRRLEREVAIKTLSVRAGTGEDSILRFEREAKAASSLRHPHILHVYDIGTEGETRYIAMELVEGETLRRKMRSGTDVMRLLEWLAQAADALAKAHSAGIVHRDVKPENIMVTDDGYAKVLDFGLAKLVPGDAVADAATAVRSAESIPGTVLGTIGYMSPEQAQGQSVDHRTDIFSFGCVLHEALAGRPPFAGQSDLDTLRRLVGSDPDPLPPHVAPEMQQIVARCLAKEPERRYASVREVIRDLAEALGGNRRGDIAKPPAQELRAVAVLPFSDLTPGRDSDYLGDGVAEEIITDLSQIEALRVVSRTSAAAFKGSDTSIPAVARALNVRYVVTGSVRRTGERLRVTAQLLEAASDDTLWAEKFDGTMDDIFDIQEKVARSIAGQLRVKLSSVESERIRLRPIANVRAYEHYLRARSRIYDFAAESIEGALDEIARAEAIVGENTVLLALKALAYWQIYNSGISHDPSYLDRAEAIGEELVRSAPQSSRGKTILGLVAIHRCEPRKAARYFSEALVQDPNDTDALTWLSLLYVLVGYPEKARRTIPRLVEIDPLNWMTHGTAMVADQADGLFDQALERLTAMTAIPGQIRTLILVQLLFQSGRGVEATETADHALREYPDDPFARMAAMYRWAMAGDHRRVRELINEQVREVARNDLQYSFWVAEIFGQVGDAAGAVDWLRTALRRGFSAWRYVEKHDRFFDNVRQDERFREALEELRLQWLAFDA
jgi:eukaryotic-like serine/threonine-protein kinase